MASSLPSVDFSRMGSVGLGGSFAGLDFWSDASPFALNASAHSFSTTADTLFMREADGSYHVLGSTNAGGSISSVCLINSTNTLYLAGTFTSVESVSATNIASYSFTSNSFSALSDGLDGPVNTLFCDSAQSQVWAGGDFTDHVALWSTSSSAWSTVPFTSLNGPVNAISASSNGSLYFGGNFTTSFASNTSNNATLGNITSIPAAPSSVLTVGHSGYLTPLTYPFTGYIDPYNQISVTAAPTTTQHLYSDPYVLLCPGEAIWLAADNSQAEVDVVGYNYLRATGARLVNGLVEGRGTTVFSINAAPDDTVIELTYQDASGNNQTCTDNCPLSTDPSVSAQDFAFTSGALSLTGLKIHLKQWQGQGAGLSSVQLLSDGAFGSAVTNTNKPLCPGPSNSSSAQHTGNWTTQVYRESAPAIDVYYVTTSVPTGSTTRPSVTFYPFVGAAAFYDIYMVIPGCTALGDCDGRTTVEIQVLPVEGGLTYTTTISEAVEQDTFTLIYTGPVDMTSSSFSPTITLSLAADPAPVQGDNYILVAEAVDLYLTNISNGTSRAAGQAVNGTKGMTNTTVSVSFGVYEYVSAVNAASVMPNTSETSVSRLGFALDMALNMSSESNEFAINTIVQSGNLVYIGGNFTVGGNYSNVVAVDGTKSYALADQGLNGVVYAAAVMGNDIYFGGNFSATATGGTPLQGLAKWDTDSQSWSSVGGVNGPVTDLVVSGSNLVVLGNFTAVNSSGNSVTTGGLAVWETNQSQWNTSGVIFGNVSTAVASGENTVLAGRVSGSSANAVNGIAMLSTGSNGPTISSLANVNFASTGTLSKASPAKRSTAHISTSFFTRFADPFAIRRRLHERADAPSIPITTAAAPAILAGAFWSNASELVTIIGGNFSAGSVSGVGFYADSQLTGPSPSVSGLVKALNVIGTDLYIGGTDVNVTGVGSNLVVYSLSDQKWHTGGMSQLSGSGTVSVNAIRTRMDTNTVVVAGSFTNAGSLGCSAVCLWDAQQAQWSTPGQGLQSGEVRAIDFAGEKFDSVIIAGSFVLPSGDVSFVASYSFDNSTWTGLGTLPGPALAVAVDDKNASNIFAAGFGSDNEPYLQQWNGESWAQQNSSLLPGSIVSQLAFVPLSKEYATSGGIENDRMLMVSGDLVIDNQGNVTSALYDGSTMIPYLVGTTSAGTLGTASTLFWSSPSFSFSVQHFLATGLVVLVAIAMATGFILLFILLFFLFACLKRRRERNRPPPKEMFEKDRDSDVSSTHQHVFDNVQAALEQSLAPSGPVVIDRERRESDASSYADEDEGRETTMRYDFEGPELQPGEMSMKAGQRVIILDDVQSHEWWYARDPASGREGVVPATYGESRRGRNRLTFSLVMCIMIMSSSNRFLPVTCASSDTVVFTPGLSTQQLFRVSMILSSEA
ncbi:cortical protein marker for cell polarity-domain-containing protein [Kockovaella imperatae]|uniref:Cortical protein marker for cell polarity-domain-containing protein n=1 Tax=Kockovaella imperatae TaxID=4999 RepID=A0A1Y1UPR3_9TREE|nr:cortical protein marker for cell polarity-domain-containing protein [Kockovaella imperatae]ORX40021.1 cortical protein marker for cell polarity-domain-containing protein [Kockovaella imperatae]